MIQHCVERLPGCCERILSDLDPGECIIADEITNNLIKSDHAASSVGRAFLERWGYDWRKIQVNCSLHECIHPKSIVDVTDKRHGHYRAKVSKFSIKISEAPGNSFNARTVMEVHKVK